MPRHGPSQSTEDMILRHLGQFLPHDSQTMKHSYAQVEQNVRTVLRRQIVNTLAPVPERPICRFRGEEQIGNALGALPPELALFVLARLYDEAHIALCQGRSAVRSSTLKEDAFKRKPNIDLNPLLAPLQRSAEVVHWQILLLGPKGEEFEEWPYWFEWRRMPSMNFDLPLLSSLSELLPAESSPSTNYAGIAGGGGSDIISASILGHLLHLHGKEMEMLVSTRTWATGSQGKQGSKMGIKREIYNHAGQVEFEGKIVPGTFRVQEQTYSEGRDLEAIPVKKHEKVFIVLDQNGSRGEIPEAERVDLREQFHAVLEQSTKPLETIAIVDTGGDVFGADEGATTTPDQDLRVQQAMSSDLFDKYNLVTVVIAPGVDAPNDAPEKARLSGGCKYSPTEDERVMLLKLLKDEYRMDGTVDGRFGKTTMALQARLRGKIGWTSLDLPTHIVDTWDNPWSSFVYIRECMSDIIFMPTKKLLPLIEPKQNCR